MRPLTVFLLQLPIQSQSYEYSRENVPLALGCLQGYAQERLGRTTIRIVPMELASHGGDASLLRFFERERPDVVGFGCALWNVERTLHCCRRIKSKYPETVIVLGGPEVSADNSFLFTSLDFDFAVVGEGERTFTELLARLEKNETDLSGIPGLARRAGDRWVFDRHRPAPIEPLDLVPSPYRAGLIGPSDTGAIAIETVRGCPYRCAYCRYPKDHSGVRARDIGRVEEELRWALETGVREVSILDPCFARRPHLRALLDRIRRLNRDGHLRLQCELNAEDLTPELVASLADAGVVEVEVGLQTTNPRALERIHRLFHRERFLGGVRMLRDSGIRVLVDVMVGLPGDRLEDVKRSIDFVVENGLYEGLKLYPLSVLPGTELRSRAVELGLRYQHRPPYSILETPHLSPDQIFAAFQYAEAATGMDFFPLDLPAASSGPSKGTSKEGEAGGIVSEIILEGDDDTGSLEPDIVPTRWEIGQSLCIHIRDPSWREKLGSLSTLLDLLLAANRFTLVDWLIPEEYAPTERALAALTQLSLWPEHPVNREYFATHTPIRSTRVFLFGMNGGSLFLAKIPLSGEETLLDRFGLSRAQRVCWIALSRHLVPDEEERLLERLREKLKPDVPALLLGDLPDGWPPKRGVSCGRSRFFRLGKAMPMTPADDPGERGLRPTPVSSAAEKSADKPRDFST